jgi:hypothetical protein
MKRAILIALSVLFALVGVGLFFLPVLARRDGITQENFEKIQTNMTENDVVDILGAPPGTYSSGAIVADNAPEGWSQGDWTTHVLFSPELETAVVAAGVSVREQSFGSTSIRTAVSLARSSVRFTAVVETCWTGFVAGSGFELRSFTLL